MSCRFSRENDSNLLTVVLISLGIGLAFGLVQGFLVAYLDIQPFIVSLAGMFFAKGMTTIVSKEPVRVTNAAFLAVKDTRVTVPGLGSNNKLGEYIPAYVEVGVIVALIVVWCCSVFCGGQSWVAASTRWTATTKAPICWASMSDAPSLWPMFCAA